MLWAHTLAYATGMVNQELCGTRIWRQRTGSSEVRSGRLLLSEGEKATLAEIAHRLGREALEHLAATANPDTILGWYRKLVANKFAGSRFRRRAGRPRMNEQLERLVVQMAKENPGWATSGRRRRRGRDSGSCVAISHMYIRMRADRPQAKGLARQIYHEPALEVRFVRGSAGRTSF